MKVMLSPKELIDLDPETRKSIRLPNGQNMPIVGLGLWMANDQNRLETALQTALEAGYRHFDTSPYCGNEEVLGRVLRNWLDGRRLKREELFIVTKLPPSGMTPDKVEYFLNLSLKKLKLDYVDLYLCTSPVGTKFVDENTFFPTDENGEIIYDKNTNLEAVWMEMEKVVHAGKAKYIGISNYNERQVDRIMKMARVPPANLQVEIHVYFQNRNLRACARRHNISISSYGSLGSPGRAQGHSESMIKCDIPNVLEDPVVTDIAKKHNKTPAQILLRFLVQQEVVVIPKSTDPERLRQNIDIFNFKLTNVDMRRLESLDRGEAGRSFCGRQGMQHHPEYPFGKC